MQPPRLEAGIRVDGVLDEPEWQEAARLTGFSQYAPVDGRPAIHRTEVLVWYSPSSIHFAIRAWADPRTIVATMADRDRLGNEDLVEILLGTYGDGRQALLFAVNALGRQMDGVLAEAATNDAGTGRQSADLNPDFVFESLGQVTDSGYQVEISIPFKSIRFQRADPQTWNIHVVRRVPATGHEESWVPARRASATFLGQAGSLEGLTGLQRGLVMDVTPAITAIANGAPGVDGWAYDRTVEAGATARWGITPNLTANGTVNPDFSQVESDASQVITDPRRALFFPEKRPFFLEGIELFRTPNNLIYSRRIVAPVAAAKLTGKAAGTDMGLLLAADGEQASLSAEDNPLAAAVRIQRDIGTSSRAGVVFTTLNEPGFHNHVAGADSRFVFGEIYALSGQLAGSFTDREEISRTAPLWNAGFTRAGRMWGFSYGFEGISDEFVAGLGFISRPGITTVRGNNSLTFYGAPGAFIERSTVSLTLMGVWDYRDFVDGRDIQDKQLFLSGNLTLRGGWRVQATAIREEFGYDPDLYVAYGLERQLGAVVDTVAFTGGPAIQNKDLSLTVTSPPLIGGLSFRTNVIFGHDVNFDEWSPAGVFILDFSAGLRPTEQLRVDGTYIIQRYDRLSDGTTVRQVHIPRLRLEYQVTPAIFIRMVGEYTSTVRDSLRDDGRSEDPVLLFNPVQGVYQRGPAQAFGRHAFRPELLFSYQPVPGTVFFLGYTGRFSDEDRFAFRGLERTGDGFFLKASYLWRVGG